MLPVGIAWSVTKKFGTIQILGVVLGITLVSPQLLNAYEVAETAAADIPTWNFCFWEMPMRGYQGQVIPAILAALLLVYLEKAVRKIIPEAVAMIFVPLFALVPTIFAAHALIGPIGWTLGEWLSTGVQWGLTSSFNWIFGLLFGGFYPALVITGLHHMSHTIDLQLIAAYNGTIMWPMIALANIAQGSAVLGIILMHRGNKKEEAISIPAWISSWLGVTEPALFGINIKFVYPFVAGMLSVALNVTANAIGIGGLPGILSIQPASMLNFILCAVVAIVIPFVLVIFFEKKNILTKFENDQLPIPKLGK